MTQIDHHQQQLLDMPVTDEEIERAVFQMEPHKAPWNSCFFLLGILGYCETGYPFFCQGFLSFWIPS